MDRIGIYHGGSIFTSERTDHDRTYFFFTTFTTRLFDSAVVRDCQTIKSARVEASLFFRPNVDRLWLFVRHPFSILINNESYSTMLIKGEKYACEACVRGHRVSNCQHSDRPLQHINKKVNSIFAAPRPLLTERTAGPSSLAVYSLSNTPQVSLCACSMRMR